MTDTPVELSSLIPAIEKVDINQGPFINIVEPEKNRPIKRKNTRLEDPGI
jgi:hypothetical protein